MADDQEDRRRHQRATVDLQVSLEFPSVQQFLSACGEGLTLRFDAGKERIVHGTARVVRVEPAGIAVEFVDLDDTSRKLVQMIVRIKVAAG